MTRVDNSRARPSSPGEMARAHTLQDIAERAQRLANAASEALARGLKAGIAADDQMYLRERIKAAQGVADRLRATPGYIIGD